MSCIKRATVTAPHEIAAAEAWAPIPEWREIGLPGPPPRPWPYPIDGSPA
jgi:hypothetical protein